MITGPDLEREADNYMEAKDMEAIRREESIKHNAKWIRYDCANPIIKNHPKHGYKTTNAEILVNTWLDDSAVLGKVFQIVCSTESTWDIGILVKQLVDKQIMGIAEMMEDYRDE